ncbi:type II toxin-antitoxin system HicA family toxin [Lacticaseibacillus pantheris]
MDSRRLIKMLKSKSWYEDYSTGNHRYFKHPSLPSKVTVPHPRKDIPKGTLNTILKQVHLR